LATGKRPVVSLTTSTQNYPFQAIIHPRQLVDIRVLSDNFDFLRGNIVEEVFVWGHWPSLVRHSLPSWRPEVQGRVLAPGLPN
jgi:hypothetical protein